MKFRFGQSIFYLGMAILFVFTTLFLFKDLAGNEDLMPGNKSSMVPAFTLEPYSPQEKRVIFYPDSPVPGDLLIIEAGPFTAEAPLELYFDFPGVVSNYYLVGSYFYAVIAISCDAEAGNYSLTVQTDSKQPESENLTATVTLADKQFTVVSFSMPPDRTAGWTAAQLADDREKVRLARETTEPHPLWLQRFISPLEGRITSEFGSIRIINADPPRRHTGIDIGAAEGAPVVAPNRGIVRLSEFLLSGGNTVIIDHGIGISSTYMHLQTINVEQGRVVDRGELIGTVGMTGYATGDHLHWEVNIGQTPVNPEQLIQNELLWIPPAYVKKYFPADH